MVAMLVGTWLVGGQWGGSGGLGKQDIPCREHLHLHPQQAGKRRIPGANYFSTRW